MQQDSNGNNINGGSIDDAPTAPTDAPTATPTVEARGARLPVGRTASRGAHSFPWDARQSASRFLSPET